MPCTAWSASHGCDDERQAPREQPAAIVSQPDGSAQQRVIGRRLADRGKIRGAGRRVRASSARAGTRRWAAPHASRREPVEHAHPNPRGRHAAHSSESALEQRVRLGTLTPQHRHQYGRSLPARRPVLEVEQARLTHRAEHAVGAQLEEAAHPLRLAASESRPAKRTGSAHVTDPVLRRAGLLGGQRLAGQVRDDRDLGRSKRDGARHLGELLEHVVHAWRVKRVGDPEALGLPAPLAPRARHLQDGVLVTGDRPPRRGRSRPPRATCCSRPVERLEHLPLGGLDRDHRAALPAALPSSVRAQPPARTRRSSENTPATCAAASSPIEWPIRKSGARRKLSSSRKSATSSANSAGCVKRGLDPAAPPRPSPRGRTRTSRSGRSQMADRAQRTAHRSASAEHGGRPRRAPPTHAHHAALPGR